MLTLLDYIFGRSVWSAWKMPFDICSQFPQLCIIILYTQLNSRITSLHEAMRLYTFLFSPNSQPQEQSICLEISPGKYFHWCSKNFPFPCRQINVESRGGERSEGGSTRWSLMRAPKRMTSGFIFLLDFGSYHISALKCLLPWGANSSREKKS